MDLVGQHKAKQSQIILAIAFAISWLIGFLLQNVAIAGFLAASSLLIEVVLFVPNWPIWNRNPLKFATKKE